MSDPKIPEEVATEKLPKALPILPLFDAVLFPKMVLPLVVMEGDSVKLVDEAMSKNRIIGLLASAKRKDTRTDPEKDLARIGTSALILKMAKTEDDQAQLLVQGLKRFRVKSFVKETPYLMVEVDHVEEKEGQDKEIQALHTNIISQFTRIVDLSPGLPKEIGAMAKSIEQPGILADMVTSTINSTSEEKQRVLEIEDVKKRLKEVTRLVNQQLEILELGNKIQSQVKGDMDKNQRTTTCASSSKPSGRNWEKKTKAKWRSMSTGKRSPPPTCLKRRAKRPTGNSTGFPECTHHLPSIPWPPPIWTGSRPCPGTRAPKTTSTSRKPEAFWTKTTSGWKNPKSGFSNFWRSGS